MQSLNFLLGDVELVMFISMQGCSVERKTNAVHLHEKVQKGMVEAFFNGLKKFIFFVRFLIQWNSNS